MKKGEILDDGDQIRTLDGARAIVTFEDGSILRLNENTLVRIASPDNSKINIHLDKGEVYNRVAKSEGREYSVYSGEVQVIALGTEFTVDRESDELKVMVLESKVEVKDKDGKSLAKVESGKKAEIKVKESKVEKVEKKNIAEKDKKDEFIA